MQNQSIVFYDGECAVCDGFVQFLLPRDRQKKLFYAALQSEIAKITLKKNKEIKPDLTTMLFLHEGKLYEKSTAALKTLYQLNIGWKLLSFILLGIPKSFRDGVYSYVAKNRYKWFGTKQKCILPHPEWRKQFL